MGKRKAKSKPPPKKARTVLPSNFTCLFCNHENAVNVRMDKKAQTGELWCKVCGQSFQTTINALSDPVDVYSDWVDACDSVAREAAEDEELRDLGREPPAIDRVEDDEDDIDPEAGFEDE